MSSKTITCFKCGTVNKNKDICSNCGAILSYIKRREIAFKKEQKEASKRRQIERETNPSFIEKYEDHKFWVVRTFITVMKSIWIAVMAVGTFIAWLVAAIAA